METKEKMSSANIQAELNRLSDAQPGASKACLFTLIVYTQDSHRIDYFKGIVNLIMQQFPCRLIFIQGNQMTDSPYLHVHVSTGIEKKKHEITSDQIFIEAGGSDLARVPFLVLPYLIPDLPIYLLWGQDPITERIILPHLQKFATRLIFDSKCTKDLEHFSKMMQSLLSSNSNQIIDMNWARIGGWREVVAETFDTKERLEQLATASLIKIVYNDRPSPGYFHLETQAIYLQAWLASRLKWEFVKAEKQEEGYLLHYHSQHGPLQIRLLSETRHNLLPEEIIEFEASDQENYVCNLKRQDNNQVVVHSSNQYQCELPFTLVLPTLRSGRSFMQEIFYQKVSEQYASILNLISLVKWR
ncbi:glucose-6-phosphate dehydrogenase assembly protein OpcA [Candidatus Protochlamydia phocaeensis]|uniref:glucose-6-phosphate dehydrogenase assembly protein OpcA n=1 Tax=Candidatus Protochlamydia phocaeensis TaxID=1414722 RepID=UPI0008382BB8|nr:glucose-6-phosphate dehydrogenase assembly protein OpcA [Candidatus Protochlamydia phocaeensis]